MKLRRAKPADAAAIANLIADTLSQINSSAYTPEQIAAWKQEDSKKVIEQRILDRRYEVWIADEQKSLVGVGVVKANELLSLYIAKKQIQTGIGSTLLHHLEKRIARHGFREIHVESSTTAASFYEKKRYAKVKNSVYHTRSVDLPCVIMHKSLAQTSVTPKNIFRFALKNKKE